MIKVITILMAVLSFQTVAADKINLKEDAMYYCVDTLSTGIHKGKTENITLKKRTLKVKGGVIIFSGYVEINSNATEYNYMLKPDRIKVATLNGTFMATSTDKGIFYTSAVFTYSEDDTINVYAAQGTCTKW